MNTAILVLFPDRHILHVTSLLIHLGDPAEIKNATRALVEGSTMDKFKLPGVLTKSRRVEVVTALKDIIAIDESVQERREGGEYIISPPSVSATYIINQILIESDQFSSIMHAWAQGLHRVKIEKRREVLRNWLNKNRELLEAGLYEEARPLSEEEQEIKQDAYYPNTKAMRISK